MLILVLPSMGRRHLRMFSVDFTYVQYILILYVVFILLSFTGGICIIFYMTSVFYKGILNSRPMNSDPWSYVISIGQVYLDNHLVSNKFEIVIALLLLYFITPNHLVPGYDIVMDFKIKGYFIFLPIL